MAAASDTAKSTGIAFMNKSLLLGAGVGTMILAAPAFAVSDPIDTTISASSWVMGSEYTRASAAMAAEEIAKRTNDFTGSRARAENTPDGDDATSVADGEIGSGLSAGGGDGRLGVWVGGGWATIENDLTSTGFDGDLFDVLGGVDYQMNDRFLAGLALGYESGDVDTTFNTGTLEASGFTIAPYAGYVLNRYFTLDFTGGATFMDYDNSRTGAGGVVTGDTEATRWFLGGNVNAFYDVDKVSLSGRIGYFYVNENVGGFTESDSTIYSDDDNSWGQLRIGGTVGYELGKVEPYVLTTYVYDVEMEQMTAAPGQLVPSNDRSGFDVGGGVRFMLSDRVYGDLEGFTHLGRDDFSGTSLTGSLRIKF
jgi:hypothetical protein